VTLLNTQQSNPCYEYAIELTKKIFQQNMSLAQVLDYYYPEYYSKMQETIDHFNKQSPNPITCKKNCDACCYYMVASVPIEAKYIYYHAKKQLTRKQIKSVVRKMRNAYSMEQKYASLYPNDVIKQAQMYRLAKIPCPFLKDRTCIIYNYRPMICRYHNVTSSPTICYDNNKIRQVTAWQHPDLMKSDVEFQKFMSHHFLKTLYSGTLNKLLLEHGFN